MAVGLVVVVDGAVEHGRVAPEPVAEMVERGEAFLTALSE